MPELPEVETTCRGIAPHIMRQRIKAIVARQTKLRNTVPVKALNKYAVGHAITAVSRRGKYLLLTVGVGHILIHLGMSGSLRVLQQGAPIRAHDHIDIIFSNGLLLRFTDPRRFGVFDWVEGDPLQHQLLAKLGPEPLTDQLSGLELYKRSRKRSIAVKQFIMDSHIVVGVGNIYANEALFRAGIHPLRQAGRIGLIRYDRLVEEIKRTLGQAIKVGGTTLRDFTGGNGEPGYFKQSLFVYGRAGKPCKRCNRALEEVRLADRSTVYCPRCQK